MVLLSHEEDDIISKNINYDDNNTLTIALFSSFMLSIMSEIIVAKNKILNN